MAKRKQTKVLNSPTVFNNKGLLFVLAVAIIGGGALLYSHAASQIYAFYGQPNPTSTGNFTFWWNINIDPTKQYCFVIEEPDGPTITTIRQTGWGSKGYYIPKGNYLFNLDCVNKSTGSVFAYKQALETH